MKILAADPGLQGALAAWDGKILEIADVPTVKAKTRGNEINLPALADIIRKLNNPPFQIAYVEKNSSRPQEGGASGRKAGKVEGILLGCLIMCCYKVITPTPSQWKKEMRLTKDKEYSRARAIELFPEYHELFARKKDHDRAEAALLAHYGLEQYRLESRNPHRRRLKDLR